MMPALWAGMGKNLADRWATLLVSPALAFWAGGLLAWVWGHGGFTGPASGWRALEDTWRTAFGPSTTIAQATLAVAALLLVAASARLSEALTLAVVRGLEGYWPGWAAPVRRLAVRVRGRAIERHAARWRDLVRRREHLSPDERAEFRVLNARRALVPPAPEERMPTRLGDVLRAAESRPAHRYGLGAVVCWAPLWLAMPEEARTELSAARTRLDEAARLWLWSLAALAWTPFAWWVAPVAVLGMVAGYQMAVVAAVTYGQLLVSCFDLYRRRLYEALGQEQPTGPAEEHAAGRRLTALLERGPAVS